MDDVDVEQRGPGRPRKEFKNASYHTQKSQTDEGMEYLRQLATDLGISVTYLINFYGKRQANINGDVELSKLFEELNRYKSFYTLKK